MQFAMQTAAGLVRRDDGADGAVGTRLFVGFRPPQSDGAVRSLVHPGQAVYEVQDEVVDGLVVGDGVEGVVGTRLFVGLRPPQSDEAVRSLGPLWSANL